MRHVVFTTQIDYIVQGHRFDIVEDVGCWPTIYISVPAIPLVYIWPLIINLVSIPYCGKLYGGFIFQPLLIVR
jgi:pheromone a factor receptor